MTETMLGTALIITVMTTAVLLGSHLAGAWKKEKGSEERRQVE